MFLSNTKKVIDKLYNSDYKIKFILSRLSKLYSEEEEKQIFKLVELGSDLRLTHDVKNYLRWFDDASNTEKKLNKDLSQFSPEEIIDMLRGFRRSKSPSAHFQACQFFFSYTNFINGSKDYEENNYYPFIEKTWMSNKNPIYCELYQDFLRETASMKYFFSLEEFKSTIEPFIQNSSDMAIIYLLFDGVKGKNVDFIRNLQIDDIDFQNKTVSINDENFPYDFMKISEHTIEECKLAYKQILYFNYDIFKKDFELQNSNYIIKQALKQHNGDKPMSKIGLYKRMRVITDDIAYQLNCNENQMFSIQTLYESGILMEVKKMILENSTLTIQNAIKLACEKRGEVKSLSVKITNIFKSFDKEFYEKHSIE